MTDLQAREAMCSSHAEANPKMTRYGILGTLTLTLTQLRAAGLESFSSAMNASITRTSFGFRSTPPKRTR